MHSLSDFGLNFQGNGPASRLLPSPFRLPAVAFSRSFSPSSLQRIKATTQGWGPAHRAHNTLSLPRTLCWLSCPVHLPQCALDRSNRLSAADAFLHFANTGLSAVLCTVLLCIWTVPTGSQLLPLAFVMCRCSIWHRLECWQGSHTNVVALFSPGPQHFEIAKSTLLAQLSCVLFFCAFGPFQPALNCCC